MARGKGKGKFANPGHAPSKNGKTVPQSAPKPPATNEMPFSYRANFIDAEYEGLWDWHLTAEESRSLLQFLCAMDGKTWGTIKSETAGPKGAARAHWQDVSDLVKDAQNRLVEIGHGDLTQIYRFRLSRKERLWGTLNNGVFEMLWWDRKHAVLEGDN